MAQGIWNGERIGDPTFDGFTFGGVYDGATLIKADYPGLRAIRAGGVVTLAVDLPASYPVVGALAPVEVAESTDQTNAQMTAATFVAGSPTCGLSFTAPLSGKVWVTQWAFLQIVTTNSSGRRLSLSSELRTGSTIGSGTVISAASEDRAVLISTAAIDAQRQVAAADRYLVTGLTPGAAYNVRTMQRVSSIAAEVTYLILARRIAVEDADPTASSRGVELWY